MFNKRKTKQLTAATKLRRSGLVALLITCGTVSLLTADDGKNVPTPTRLQALPPLPVGINRLQASQTNSPRINKPAAIVRTNPFVDQAAGQPTILQRVGATAPIEIVDSPDRLVGQFGGQTASVAIPTFNPHATEGPAKLLRSSGPIVSLKRVGEATVSGRDTVTGPGASVTEGETVTALPSPSTSAAAATPAAVVEISDSQVSTSFTFSDQESAEISEQALAPAGDQIVMLDGSAELMQVVRPKLLSAAAPLMLDGDAAKLAQYGDVRSASVPRSLRGSEATATATAATPLRFETPGESVDTGSIDTGSIDTESFQKNASVSSQYATSAIPLPKPMSLDEIPQQQDLVPLEDAAVEPVLAMASNPPVPQIYRPKQSLVIDVPVAKPYQVETVSSDEAEQRSESESLFAGTVSEVLPIAVAQSYAHVPTEAVRRVQLEDRDICEAVLVGAHKLLLIGRREGATRLAIWCGEAVEPTLYEIQVGGVTSATPGSSLEAIATRLTETIATTYPRCRVRVVPQGEGLAVVGQASDSKSARDILRLVRSACLKSVDDQLSVR